MEKEEALPTERGSLIKVTKLDGETGEWLARLDVRGLWTLFDLIGEDDARWMEHYHVEEWHHIEIFEVTP